jgi:cell cycle sensor histidine kinase DivJ
VSLVTIPADEIAEEATRPPEEAALRRVLAWHLAWSAAVLAALVVAALGFGGLPTGVGAGLLLAALPGFLAQGLRWRDDDRARDWLIYAWSATAALSPTLSGGVAGPLATWCAAPLAAAFVLDRRSLVPGAAALSLAALAMALWAGLTGATEAPRGGLQLWLGFISVLTLAGALAAGLMLSARSGRARNIQVERAGDRLKDVLAEQPHLIMVGDEEGRVSAAYGAPPAGVSTDLLLQHGLIVAARHQDRPDVRTALAQAHASAVSEVGFAPLGAPDRWVRLSLRRTGENGLVGTLRDATTDRDRELALEAERVRSDALNQGKSRFLANMSHELRTPLNAVIGFSDIMRQRMFGPIPEKYAEYAQLIHESGGHLLDLINDVLDMSKIEADRYQLHLEPFDGRDPVNAALRLVRLQAHESGVALRGIVPSEPLPVRADKRALKQIALNLLSNALKFTHEGGSVTVTLVRAGGAFELTVSDTGVGIAPEDLERIGRPYEQAGDTIQRAQGTGLGLSLVRALAELHGGSVGIESTLGEGTAVTVRLPVMTTLEALQLKTAPEPLPVNTGGAEVIPLKTSR